MKQVPEGFELVDDPQPLAMRYPGVAMTLLGVVISGAMVIFGTWVDDRHRPQLEEIRRAITDLDRKIEESARQSNRANRFFGVLGEERARYTVKMIEAIASSSRIKIPPKPAALERAEGHVLGLQERVN